MDDVVVQENYPNFIILRLNRPKQLNAFNQAQHHTLYRALEVVAGDDTVRAIILTGTGRGFCAGQDLGDRDPSKRRDQLDLGETLEKFYNPLIRLIRNMPKPIICAVNGVAAGAGANIAFACDFVLSAKSARFIQSFVKLGLVPDAGGSYHLTHMLGEARAKALTMLGTPLTAKQAEAWGLIYRVIPDADLIKEAKLLAQQLVVAPTYGIGLTKLAIHAAWENNLEQQLNLERDYQRMAGFSPDYDEGVAAFLEKRVADFTGKPPEGLGDEIKEV